MIDKKTIIIVLCLFLGGYWCGVKSDESAENDRRKLAQDVAERVQRDVTKWKQNIRTVEKVEPIYLNQCVTDDYRRVFNQNQRLLSGKPVPKMSSR